MTLRAHLPYQLSIVALSVSIFSLYNNIFFVHVLNFNKIKLLDTNFVILSIHKHQNIQNRQKSKVYMRKMVGRPEQ